MRKGVIVKTAVAAPLCVTCGGWPAQHRDSDGNPRCRHHLEEEQ